MDVFMGACVGVRGRPWRHTEASMDASGKYRTHRENDILTASMDAFVTCSWNILRRSSWSSAGVFADAVVSLEPRHCP